MQWGDFNQQLPEDSLKGAETCRNSKIKRDFNDILWNINIIIVTFKKNNLYFIRDGNKFRTRKPLLVSNTSVFLLASLEAESYLTEELFLLQDQLLNTERSSTYRAWTRKPAVSKILWRISSLLRNGLQSTRYIIKTNVTDMVFARNGFQSTRYITKTDVSIASQRLGIPRKRLK
jgi:hypothetical protein